MQICGSSLCRQNELIVAGRLWRTQGAESRQVGGGCGRRPDRGRVERQSQRKLFAMWHNDAFRDGGDAGEGKAFNGTPWKQPANCGIPARGGNHGTGEQDKNGGNQSQQGPAPMTRIGHRFGKIPLAHDGVDLIDGRLGQTQTSRGFAFAVHQFDSPQYLITECRVFLTQQHRHLFQLPSPPDPAVELCGDQDHGTNCSGEETQQAHSPWRIHEPIDEEQSDPGQQDSESGRQNSFGHLDTTDQGTKLNKPIQSRLGKLK